MENEKPYALETENRGSYLYAIVGGLSVTPEVGKQYWAEIVDECDELGLSKILIEKNFVETYSPEQLIHLKEEIDKMLRGKTIAFVDRFHHDDISELAKALARPSGITVRIFNTADDAEKWLLAN